MEVRMEVRKTRKIRETIRKITSLLGFLWLCPAPAGLRPNGVNPLTPVPVALVDGSPVSVGNGLVNRWDAARPSDESVECPDFLYGAKTAQLVGSHGEPLVLLTFTTLSQGKGGQYRLVYEGLVKHFAAKLETGALKVRPSRHHGSPTGTYPIIGR